MQINRCFKMILVAFAMISLSFSSFSQNKTILNQPDERLFQIFDKSYIEQNPKLMLYYNYCLDNSFYVVSLKSEKPITGEDIHSVMTRPEFSGGKEVAFNEKTYDKNTFNVLKYNFHEDYKNVKTYIWKEAGVAFIFYPTKTFQENYKEFVNQNK